MKTKEISFEVLSDLLTYNPETGLFFWKVRPLNYFCDERSCKIWNTRYAGKRAGSLRVRKKDGYSYFKIGIFNEDFMAHRLAWILMTGCQPPREIDHINMDATDCRWSNLRDGEGVNQRNKTMMKNNTSGYLGVHKHSRCVNRYVARSSVNGKAVHLGMFASAEDAYKAVLDFNLKNGFSIDHGMKKKSYGKRE